MVIPTLKILRTLLQFLVRVLLFSIIAENRLVDHRVEYLLFPSMVLSTEGLQGASLLVLANKVASLPSLTDLKGIVQEQMWLSAEILPVVGITALGLVVLGAERTPLSFEVKHVELLVARHLVDQGSFNVQLSVSEAAVLLVLALVEGLGAEFGLVLLNVVQSLNLVVRELARHVVALLMRAEVNTITVNSCAPALV